MDLAVSPIKPTTASRIVRFVADRYGSTNEHRLWLLLTVGLGGLSSIAFLIVVFVIRPDSIQDDALMFTSYMGKWDSATVLKDDLVAGFWQSVSPWAYEGVFRLAWLAGIPPTTFVKIVPALLFPLVAYFCYRLQRGMHFEPMVAWAATAFVLYEFARRDVIMSGTPRSFWPLCFLAMLDGLQRRKPVQVVIAQLFLAGTYPQLALVGGMVIGLSFFDGRDGRYLDFSRFRVALVGAAAVATIAGALPFLMSSGHYGPTMTLADAANYPTFSSEGRGAVFQADGSLDFVCGRRIGFMTCDTPFEPVTILLFIGMFVGPFVLFWRTLGKTPAGTMRSRLPFFTFVASWIGFVAAALVLFRMHLPDRYTIGLYILMLLTAVPLALQTVKGWLTPQRILGWPFGRYLLVASFGAGVIGASVASSVTDPHLHDTEHAGLVEAIKALPEDAVVGGLAIEMDLSPTLTQRSTLFNRELAIAYQSGYFKQIMARMNAVKDIVLTHYPPTMIARLEELKLTRLVVARTTLDDARIPARIAPFFGDAGEEQSTKASLKPTLVKRLAPACTTGTYGDVVMLDASCLIGEAKKLAPAG